MRDDSNCALISASTLYNLVACEHRVHLDAFGDESLRDAIHPFVEWLWRNGISFEAATMAGSGNAALNLRDAPKDERERLTVEAIQRREPLIYGGKLSADDLVGEPDLLRLEENGYVPIDIKSGAGTDNSSVEAKPKGHYAVQLALYVDILERLGVSAGRFAYVWDRFGDEVLYDFTAPKSVRNQTTLWNDYGVVLDKARAIFGNECATSPASTSICKQCHWYSECLRELTQRDDLSLLPELGRARREALLEHVATISELAARDMVTLLDTNGRSVVKGFSEASLLKYINRAMLRSSGGDPYAKEPIVLPPSVMEVVLDIENHPFRDRCYLHGILSRRIGSGIVEHSAFFADEASEQSERAAFNAAWEHLQLLRPFTLYTYSNHERTWWRKMQRRYPDVCSDADIDGLFDPETAVDLYYGIILSKTEWPTNDFSLKTLASHCGFVWRDAEPSGSASIVWYDEHLSGSHEAKQRVLEYNEDDCRATLALVDVLRELDVRL